MENFPEILKLDLSGNPTDWIKYDDAAYYYAKDLVVWDLGESEILLRGGISSKTGTQSKLNIKPIICVRGDGMGKRFRSRPRLTKKALFARDRQICAYCGNRFSTTDLQMEHVIPVSKSGPTIWENMVSACARCNGHKADRTPEDAGMQLLYVPYAPSRIEHLIMMNRHILADQMSFLEKMLPDNSKLVKMFELEKTLSASRKF